MFTIHILNEAYPFGEYPTKAKAEEDLILQGWKRSAVTGYCKDGMSAVVVPYFKARPIEELKTFKGTSRKTT